MLLCCFLVSVFLFCWIDDLWRPSAWFTTALERREGVSLWCHLASEEEKKKEETLFLSTSSRRVWRKRGKMSLSNVVVYKVISRLFACRVRKPRRRSDVRNHLYWIFPALSSLLLLLFTQAPHFLRLRCFQFFSSSSNPHCHRRVRLLCAIRRGRRKKKNWEEFLPLLAIFYMYHLWTLMHGLGRLSCTEKVHVNWFER